jgi:DNA-binding transcriptional LysR family regulator
MLKLSKLEVFAVVSEEGSFSAAAERLHLSQPAVSRHIQELEETLGIRLFKRQRRGVELTSGGEVLKEYTERILWLVREAEGALTDVSRLLVGQVRIDATPGVSVYLMPTWTQAFSQKYRNLTVSIRTRITGDAIEDLLSGRTDIAFVEGELEELAHERVAVLALQKIEQVLVVGRGHRWWDVNALPAAELDQEPFVTRQPGSRTRVWIDGILRARNVHPYLVAEFDSPEAIKEAVMNGLGVTILPTYTVARERAAGLLRAIPLAELKLEREIKLLWDSSRPFSPVTRAFLAHIAESFPVIDPIIPARLQGIFGED